MSNDQSTKLIRHYRFFLCIIVDYWILKGKNTGIKQLKSEHDTSSSFVKRMPIAYS